MRVLHYKDLDLRGLKTTFAKVRAAIEADDFKSADVKKLHVHGYYRAKLDYSNRLLLQFARMGTETVCLALEVIANHAYEKSRFLRGASVDETKIEGEACLTAATPPEPDTQALRWLHATRPEFELLDKPIVFDDAQEAVRRLPAPVVLVGSAGSGKTAVTLSKLREASGRVLYVTQSPYLAQSARALYGAHAYDNEAQEVEFLSYREFIETLRVPVGRELTFPAFAAWYERHRAAAKPLAGVDAHAMFEEFRGVLGAQVSGPLSLPNYLALGARQSLLSADLRSAAHGLFERYRAWLTEAGWFDLNLQAHGCQTLAQPAYDFIVIDEVQDLTVVQLALVLACLKTPGQFLLCGDSNQIVHPNFFSWAAVRGLFWKGLGATATPAQALHVLQANFRNTLAVTQLANQLLKIKQARFGSIDRESNFLVQCASVDAGEVQLLKASEANLKLLDERTRASVQHAVIVLRDEDKPAARAQFRTPLVFSVHEAKGLEYPHVVLLGLVSGQRAAYAELCEGVTAADLEREELAYGRAKDKGDKSLELYKFYVNALYVAMTRAVQSLTLLESDLNHPLLDLLHLSVAEARASTTPSSSKEEWAQEARKLELQGKQEQAQAIRDTFLQHKPVPWTAWSQLSMEALLPKVFDKQQVSNKPRQALFDYALWHGQQAWVEQLSALPFAPARALAPLTFGLPLDLGQTRGALERHEAAVWRAIWTLRQRHLQSYAAKNFKDLLKACDVYGVDHCTPVGASSLMMAAGADNVPLVDALLARGADSGCRDEFGHTAWLQTLARCGGAAPVDAAVLTPLFERLAPAHLDVQVDGRLVRLEHHQGEYWVLSLMMALLKTQWSLCRPNDAYDFLYKNETGFHAQQLEDALARLPRHLWRESRRKRSYVNAVLARAETHSKYQPARRLWSRAATGYYLPNPTLLVRQGEAWVNLYQQLNFAWITRGCQPSPNAHHIDPGLHLCALGQGTELAKALGISM